MSAPRNLERIGREITAARDRLRRAVLYLNIPHHQKEATLAAIDDLEAITNTLSTTTNAVVAEVNTLKSGENETRTAAVVSTLQGVQTTLAGVVTPPAQ